VSPAPSQVATTILCINGSESRNWRDETSFFDGLAQPGFAVAVVDPRGVAQRRPKFEILGRGYVDPLVGVEENIAYNAFLVGKSLLGMRVTDVVFAVRKMLDQAKPKRVVLCARADAALIACFAAALEPAIELVATEGMILSFRSLFSANAAPINAASILPDLVRRYGDIAEVVGEIAPRRVLVAAGVGTALSGARNVSAVPDRFSQNPRILTDWIRDRG
jgi:pimeloyl-ACP methyl ester carboxylesterase